MIRAPRLIPIARSMTSTMMPPPKKATTRPKYPIALPAYPTIAPPPMARTAAITIWLVRIDASASRDGLPHVLQRSPTGPSIAHFMQIGWSHRPQRTHVSRSGWR